MAARVEMVSCWASLPDGHNCSADEPVSDDAIINYALQTYKGSASSEALSFRKLSLRVRWRAAHSVRSTSYFIFTHLRPGQINGHVDLMVGDLGRIADRVRGGKKMSMMEDLVVECRRMVSCWASPSQAEEHVSESIIVIYTFWTYR